MAALIAKNTTLVMETTTKESRMQDDIADLIKEISKCTETVSRTLKGKTISLSEYSLLSSALTELADVVDNTVETVKVSVE
jgi:hypothetical protein